MIDVYVLRKRGKNTLWANVMWERKDGQSSIPLGYMLDVERTTGGSVELMVS